MAVETWYTDTDGILRKQSNLNPNSNFNNQGYSNTENGWEYNRSAGIYNKFNNPEVNTTSSSTPNYQSTETQSNTPSNTQINFADYNNLYGTNLLNNLLNTYNYNTDKSARWNRKLMKQNLMSAGMSRKDAKAMATDITGRVIASDNGIGTNADKRWVNNRAALYHDNGKGGIVRNQTNTGNILGSIGMGLIGGPAAAGMYAATRNWNNGNQSRWTPGQLPNLQPPIELPLLIAPQPTVQNNPVQPVELPSVQNNPAPITPPVTTPWELTEWKGIANKYGLNSEDEVKNIQRLMQSAGLYSGAIDGKFGDASRKAYEQMKLRYNRVGSLFYTGLTKSYIDTMRNKKQGGSIQKHQQGGIMSQEDQLEKMLTYATLGMIGYANSLKQPMDFTTAVSQVMELALSKPEALQEIASNKELIQAGVEIMKQQEPDTLLIISQPGGMRKVLAQLKQKKTMAKQGTKLDYIKNLKGICPEGYEMLYMKAGGSVGVCPVCKKKALKAEVEMDKCGKKMKKHAQGGISELMNSIKAELFLKGGKPKIEHTDKEGNTYEYNDSTELKQHQDLIKKFKSKKPMTKEETKKLLELNKRLTS